MNAQHTPGPHNVVRITDEDGRHFLVTAPNGCPLAKLEHCAEDKWNATLFAAAESMLADLSVAATTLRRYEALHRAKAEAASACAAIDSLKKAEANAELAARFEATIAMATGSKS